MQDKLLKELLKAITFIPGIIGITNLDFSMKPTKLSEDKWSEGIRIEINDNGVEVSVSIIVDKDIKAKVIAKELSSSITQLIKKETIQKSKLNIYVRGIK